MDLQDEILIHLFNVRNIKYYQSNKIYKLLKQADKLDFRFLDLSVKYQEAFGLLEL
jgi:hypothetical protein